MVEQNFLHGGTECSPRWNEYAAQLLREKDCSITEISDDSGFSDVRYFREVFRKYYGMSPSEYRNSMRG